MSVGEDEETAVEGGMAVQAAIALDRARQAHKRLDNGIDSFKELRKFWRNTVFGSLLVIVGAGSITIWRASAVMARLEFIDTRLSRIEKALNKEDLAMTKEHCPGCGKETDKGLINMQIENGSVRGGNCEHCADPNDYRTPEAWKGSSISETTTIDPHMQTAPVMVITDDGKPREGREPDLTPEKSNEGEDDGAVIDTDGDGEPNEVPNDKGDKTEHEVGNPVA